MQAALAFAEGWRGVPTRVIRTSEMGFDGSDRDRVIQVVVRGAIEFVHGAEFLEAAFCPFCDAKLWPLTGTGGSDWFDSAFNAAHDSGYRDLAVRAPCCRRPTSLNDLRYHWPAGFARFTLTTHDPFVEDVRLAPFTLPTVPHSPPILDRSLLQRIGEALGCEVRAV